MRPLFHFTAAGWINDPHGITVHGGRYHAFYQSVPGSTSWDLACRWGHAIGPDLLSLVELPPALGPGDGEDGIWTGCLVTDDAGDTRILYTAVDAADLDHGRVRTATPVDDGWVGWRKGEVVVRPPEGVASFRDPAVRRDPDGWRMVMGGGTGTAGVALSYRSDDLATWDYEGVALSRDASDTEPLWTGEGWECPQIVDVDGGHALVFSVWQPSALHHAVAAVGEWGDGVFSPRAWQRVSYGPSPYAPSCFSDAAGRLAIVFWLRGVEGDGWAGAHSIPLLLSRVGDELRLAVHPDVEAYATGGDGPARALLAEAGATPLVVATAAGAELATVAPDGDELVVTVGGESTRMPGRGPARMIVDGPVLEVVTATAVYAAPLPDEGENRVVSGADRVRRLERAG